MLLYQTYNNNVVHFNSFSMKFCLEIQNLINEYHVKYKFTCIVVSLSPNLVKEMIHTFIIKIFVVCLFLYRSLTSLTKLITIR